MIAVLLSALFLASGFLAAATIASSWHRHGPTVRTLRAELAAFTPSREVRVFLREVSVRSTATVLQLKPSGPLARPAQPSAAAA